MKHKIYYLLHGILFAAGSGVSLYMAGDLANFNPPREILLPTLFSILLYLPILLLSYLLTRRLEVAGLFATFFILGILYHWKIFFLILGTSLVSLLVFLLVYKEVGFKTIHVVLNNISIGVIGYYLYLIVILVGNTPRISNQSVFQQIPTASSESSNSSPDIYYIVLDGYGREDMLQSVHGFDNSEFMNALEERGFIITSDSQANYPVTYLSLASSLNMQYLDTLGTVMGSSEAWWPIIDLIHHSQVRKFLEEHSYKTVFFPSGWDYTDIRDGDYYETPYPIILNNLHNSFLVLTNLRLLESVGDWGIAWPSYETHRQIILNNFNRLPEVALIEGPKFVFSHIIAAHPPFVFDREGNPIDPEYKYSFIDPIDRDLQKFQEGYIDQLQYINQEILTTVDQIIAHSVTPPVIILQSDHGPGIHWNPSSVEDTCLYERYSIMNAFYLPGIDPTSLPADISQVNTFRYIFNQYFQTQLEILPNRNYFSSTSFFYHFIEITGKISNSCP